MTATDSLVDAYLDRLEAELAGVPRAGRREVLDEIETHVVEARAALPADDETEVRNLLERLGDPAEIAAEVRERYGVARPHATWREIAALILLPFGGVVIPVVGWFAGVILLWVSDAWSSRDKVIGTLVIPGGCLVPFFLFALVGSTSGSSCITSPTDGHTVCSGGGGTDVWPAVLLVLLVLAPLVADGYLIWRLRRGVRAAV
jgi:uncharacterized membrane protein